MPLGLGVQGELGPREALRPKVGEGETVAEGGSPGQGSRGRSRRQCPGRRGCFRSRRMRGYPRDGPGYRWYREGARGSVWGCQLRLHRHAIVRLRVPRGLPCSGCGDWRPECLGGRPRRAPWGPWGGRDRVCGQARGPCALRRLHPNGSVWVAGGRVPSDPGYLQQHEERELLGVYSGP